MKKVKLTKIILGKKKGGKMKKCKKMKKKNKKEKECAMDYCFNPQYIGCDWTVKTKFSFSSILKK